MQGWNARPSVRNICYKIGRGYKQMSSILNKHISLDATQTKQAVIISSELLLI